MTLIKSKSGKHLIEDCVVQDFVVVLKKTLTKHCINNVLVADTVAIDLDANNYRELKLIIEVLRQIFDCKVIVKGKYENNVFVGKKLVLKRG